MKSKQRKHLPWNWRSRVEIIRYDETVMNCGRGRFRMNPAISFTLTFKKGQTPKGFRKQIARLDIDNKPPYFIESVEMDDYFVRRGLGTLLYFHALNQLGSLTTLYHRASKSAQGLWRFLVRNTRSHKTAFFCRHIDCFQRR